MARHTAIILVLCAFGFLKEFRPSEPFLSPFLNGPKNFTETEINNDIYPIGTYSHMALLIVIFLMTDWLKYKPVILLQGITGIFTYSLLLWGRAISIMQVAQVCYGLFSACDVAYSSYLYAKIDRKHYQKATAQTKAVLLISKAGSGMVSQILVNLHLMDYLELNYLTLTAMSLATIWACCLPPVEESSFFNRRRSISTEKNDEEASPLKNITAAKDIDQDLPALSHPPSTSTEKLKEPYSLRAIYMLWKKSMENHHTLKWSLWSALSLCGYLQVSYYIQLLWQARINAGGNLTLYHGFSNSFNSLAGAVCTYAVGYVKLDWTKWGEPTLAIAAILQGCLIVFASYMQVDLFIHYTVYAAFKILYQVANTVVSSEIARSLESESFGLVFGANQFFALVAQSLLTIIVTKVLCLNIRFQFYLYGGYFLSLGVSFAAAGAIKLISSKCSQRNGDIKNDIVIVEK